MVLKWDNKDEPCDMGLRLGSGSASKQDDEENPGQDEAIIANEEAEGRCYDGFRSSGSSSVVERQLPKLNVAGSIPVSRSIRISPVALILYILLTTSHALLGQTISRAECGKDHKAHLIFQNGKKVSVPIEKRQVECESMRVSDDRHSAAWSVLVENCCTSYPVPAAVAVFRDGKKTVMFTGQMVWDWHFVGTGDRIAILSGPVHGNPSTASLYDTKNGKRSETWEGKGQAPTWAALWTAQFQH